MQEKCSIVSQIKGVANLINREFCNNIKVKSMKNITGMHCWVILYLYKNRNREVFQKEIESYLLLRSPSVTSLLQLMEKNELIVREQVPMDARLKRIVLTEKACEMVPDIRHDINAMETKLAAGLTQEEMETLSLLLHKVKHNMK